jgi:hypothetical protein
MHLFRLYQWLLCKLPPGARWRLTIRIIVAAFTGLVALAVVSAEATPLPPAKASPAELRAAPSIELVRQGCGWSWHRGHWRDRWGYWHWGRCYPNW